MTAIIFFFMVHGRNEHYLKAAEMNAPFYLLEMFFERAELFLLPLDSFPLSLSIILVSLPNPAVSLLAFDASIREFSSIELSSGNSGAMFGSVPFQSTLYVYTWVPRT